MNKESVTISTNEIKSSNPLQKRIAVAGIGNIFLKDDGFGIAVIKKLKERNQYPDLELYDVGIGGLKLAYDLLKGYDGLILVDCSPQGEEPGTLYVMEPRENEIKSDFSEDEFVDPHGGDPATILRFIKALGAWPGKVFIVGCEPGDITDFEIGLSGPVAESIDNAVKLVENLILSIHEKNGSHE